MTLTLATLAPGSEAPEIFAALQGEGVSAGRPCVFVRLSRCNLACRWCDTAYTWDFTSHPRAANQVTLSIEDVAARITALALNRLVITGGEPLLQVPALARLVALLPDHTIEVETNGSAVPPAGLAARIDQWNVSPKLAHSGNPRALAIRAEAITAFAAMPHAWFKFVIVAPEDIDEVLALASAHRIAPSRIHLMPEGRDSATLRARLAWLAPLAAEHRFATSDRLHIHAFGDTRGT